MNLERLKTRQQRLLEALKANANYLNSNSTSELNVASSYVPKSNSQQRLQFHMEVYPNPTIGWLNIEATMSGTNYMLLDVYDEARKKVASIKKIGEALFESINLSDQKSGTYFIEVQSDTEVLTKEIVLRK
jgi:hypothetical protein